MRSLADVSVIDRLLAHRRIEENGCWIWTGSAPRYGYLWFKGRMRPVHRLMASVAFGIDETDRSIAVLHSCDRPRCFNPAHLFLGDQSVNMRDAAAKGRLGHPAWNKGASKVDAEVVARVYASGDVSMRELSSQFGVSAPTIFRALRASQQ